MNLDFTEGLFICLAFGVCMSAGYGIVMLIGFGIQKLRGKRPYDGRFRTGGCL